METITFLQTVLPSDGLFCAASPFQNGKGFEHLVHDSIEHLALSSLTTDHHRKNAYFALGTLKERQVLRQQPDGSIKQVVRTQDNIHQLKTFFLDIDVKPGEPDEHYEILTDAWHALWGFITAAGLPSPYVVCSGGGLHVYFPFTEPLNKSDWTTEANKLKELCKHYKLKCDHQLTANCANVLRVPGTNNWKTGEARLVYVMLEGKVTPLEEFVAILDAKVAEHDLVVRQHQPSQHKSSILDAMMVGNDPINPGPVIANCQQINNAIVRQGNINEPYWYAALQLVRHFQNGNNIAHALSQGHPEYSHDKTEQKLDQLKIANVGPTSCAKFDDVNPGGCKGCAYRERVANPVSIVRLISAPPPTLEVKFEEPVAPVQPQQPIVASEVEYQQVSTVMVEVNGQFSTLPPPPKPYLRNAMGEVLMIKADDKGNESEPAKILDHDLYPFKREMSRDEGGEVVWFRRFLPHDGWRDFAVPTSALYAPDKIFKVLADNGVLPLQSAKQHVVSYMTAYSKELQKVGKAVEMHSHFGWLEDGETFVIGDRVYHKDGRVVKSGVAKPIQDEAKSLEMKGDINVWKQAFGLYNRDGYEPWAFMAMLGFGAPLLRFFHDYKGVIVDLYGPSGSGKSTATKFAASIFGSPKQNILRLDDTSVSKFKVLGTYHNLPVTLDEITNIHPKELSQFAYSVTEGREKRRMSQDATLRSDSQEWHTLILASSNAKIMDKLTMAKGNAAAEQYRVFEMHAPDKKDGITKQEADAATDILLHNHGVAGHVYAHHLVTNQEDIKNKVHQVAAMINQQAGLENRERFWSAVLSVGIVGAAITRELKLHDYDVMKLMQWGIAHIGKMRGVVKESMANAVEILGQFTGAQAGNVLVTGKVIIGDAAIVKEPRGELTIRHDMESGMTYVDKKTFWSWCIEQQYSPDEVCEDLVKNGLLVDGYTNQRTYSLGTKTHYAGAAVRVLIFDLRQQAAGNGKPTVVEQGRAVA